MTRQIKLAYGIHRHTLTSRDTGDPYFFNTEDEALTKVQELEQFFGKRGYVLWFATLTFPDGTKKTVRSNVDY